MTFRVCLLCQVFIVTRHALHFYQMWAPFRSHLKLKYQTHVLMYLSWPNINLANVIALQATTFTYYMPHWHGTVHVGGTEMIRQRCSHSHAVLCTDWGKKTIHQRNTTEAKLFGIQRRQQKVLNTIESDDAQDLQPKDKNIRLCDTNPVTVLIAVAKKK